VRSSDAETICRPPTVTITARIRSVCPLKARRTGIIRDGILKASLWEELKGQSRVRRYLNHNLS
jgi:hypothetical protein